jgi:cell division septum initiation protein DivIVA
MAISFSRPDPSSPAAVGAAQFTVGRRGFEQEEVRDFLRMVSAELARLQERERFLESELRAMQTRGMSAPGVLDEETVTALLGEETARVLTVAREAAQQMRLRAAESAERLVREASADASRMRQDAELEAARRQNDAAADVEAEIELAKQQGRDMVNEAREYREKVLSELARRRELARQQIEQLIHNRDRLVSAFDRARNAADDVVGDLAEFDDLSQEIARAAASVAPSDPTEPVIFDHTKDPEAIPQRSMTMVVDEVEEDVEEAIVVEESVVAEAIVVEEVVVEVDPAPVSPKRETPAGMSDHPSTDPPTEEHFATVVQLFGNSRKSKVDQPEVEAEVPVAKKPQKKSADDLFAKLRQSTTSEVANNVKKPALAAVTPSSKNDEKESRPVKPKAKVVVPKVDKKMFEQRDDVLAPLKVQMVRKVKRVLADEENAMLTYLQGKKSVVALETLLPAADTHAQQHIEALTDDVMTAAMAGAKSLSPSLKADLRKRVTNTAVMQVLSKNIDETIVRPLRERIQRGVEQSNGDRDEMASLLRSVFREWKMQRVEQFVADIAVLAYSRGAYLTLDQGTKMCWMVDPNGPSCADAEDNSLAGATALGDNYPTGHQHPTAHAGCRCLLAPIGE